MRAWGPGGGVKGKEGTAVIVAMPCCAVHCRMLCTVYCILRAQVLGGGSWQQRAWTFGNVALGEPGATFSSPQPLPLVNGVVFSSVAAGAFSPAGLRVRVCCTVHSAAGGATTPTPVQRTWARMRHSPIAPSQARADMTRRSRRQRQPHTHTDTRTGLPPAPPPPLLLLLQASSTAPPSRPTASCTSGASTRTASWARAAWRRRTSRRTRCLTSWSCRQRPPWTTYPATCPPACCRCGSDRP